MELLFGLLILAWFYTLLDSKEASKKEKDQTKQNIKDAMNKESSFDKYLKELDDVKYEIARKNKYIKKQNNIIHKSNIPFIKPEPVVTEDIIPDVYTGSNQWYADKEEYLKSQQWYDLKIKRQKLDNNMCVICSNTDNLNCHHTTYEHLFKEDINELRTLCSGCHQDLHDTLGYEYYKTFSIEKYLLQKGK